MNQKQLSLVYRGTLLLVAGGTIVALLSRADQPWAKDAGSVGTGIWLIAVGVFTILVTLRHFRQFLNAPARDDPLPKSLYSDSWYHLARLAVAASVLLALTLAAVLLLVEPPQQCPDWRLPGKHSMPWWLFFIWTAPLLAGLSFIVARWQWVLRKAIESVDYPVAAPLAYTLVMTVLVGCAMSQLPWVELFSKCWPGG